MDIPIFTHCWHSRFGWETTMATYTDFARVEFLGENEEGYIYLAYTTHGIRYILRDANKGKR